MKIFITSSLPYCNACPHLGNIIGSTLSGDIYARFKRSQGHEVVYLCGTDEYGSTTMIKAKKEGMTCQQICDRYSMLHKQVYDWFNIQFDVWGRTSTEMQTKITHEIFLELYRNGYIEGKTLTQFYCERCQMFLADRYIKGTCYHSECKDKLSIANGDQCDFCQKMIDVNRLIDPFCDTCNPTGQGKSKPIPRDTDHLFLCLDKLATSVEKYIATSKFKHNVQAIAKSWLATGLTPRCITRDLTWGTPVPKGVDEFLDKFSNKAFYVWFDAPIGYYSILANARPDWREFLQSPDLKWVSTQAKDNIPFHTVFFPATILGSGLKYPLISEICGTDYLLYEGQKFSKSGNIGIFGDQVMQISLQLKINEDYWRFYLTKVRPESADSNFSVKEFIMTIKTDLINNIGNFINRCVSLSKKFCKGKMVYKYEAAKDYSVFRYRLYTELMEEFRFRDALKVCLEISDAGNLYLQGEKPWELATDESVEVKDKAAKPKYKTAKAKLPKDESAKLKYDPIKATAVISRANMFCWLLIKMLEPFIPRTCQRLLTSIKCNITHPRELLDGTPVIIEILDNYEVPFRQIEMDDLTCSFGDKVNQ